MYLFECFKISNKVIELYLSSTRDESPTLWHQQLDHCSFHMTSSSLRKNIMACLFILSKWQLCILASAQLSLESLSFTNNLSTLYGQHETI